NRAIKIIELEQSLSHEQQRRTDIQRSLQEVQLDLLKAKASAKEANEKNIELEKRVKYRFFKLNNLYVLLFNLKI
ncbi:unnamed protein product, partial [Didymodactylos carnosus]